MSLDNTVYLPFSGQVFAHKINFISTALAEHNIDLNVLFKGTSIDVARLNHCTYKIHKDQVIKFYQNILALNNPHISLWIGAAIMLQDYGLYGCTLLSCRDLRQSVAFAIRYHQLVTRTVNMSLHDVASGELSFRFEDLLQDKRVSRFNIELQCVIILSLVRQCLNDQSFTFKALRLSTQRDDNHKLLKKFVGCHIYYGQPFNEFLFNHQQWRLKTAQSNPIAMPLLLNQCDSLLSVVSKKNEFLNTINGWIKDNIHSDLCTEKLADELFLTPRTLRRKLSEQGTNFTNMVKDFRCMSTKKLLVETDLTIEEVAASVGFNDVSNFRAAFKKWTGHTPTSIRQAR
jgi:AraC-like DNA-binding protein